MYARSVGSNVFSYIVVHCRPVVCLLNNLISLCTARISCYRGIVYKFEYLKL